MATGSVVAACGSSSTQPAASGSPASSSGSAAAYTVKSANVPGVGTVLVNGDGRTLYLLTSEKGGKITCTDANGCTKVWPDTELPSGVAHGIAGNGSQSSLLGAVKDSSGDLYLTYAGYPLYTYSGDSSSAQAHGQGIMSFGGTWEAISVSGAPVSVPPTSGGTASGGGSRSGASGTSGTTGSNGSNGSSNSGYGSGGGSGY